jgi:heterodisulfide reductase subunit A
MQLTHIIEETRAYRCQDCGSCTALCPPARIGGGRFTPRRLVNLALLEAEAELAQAAWPCLTCGRCAATCPAGVDLLLLVRRCRELALSAVRPAPAAPHRVGVFLCHCGSNIASVVDLPQVAEQVQRLEEVAFVEANFYTCSEDGLDRIRSAVKHHNLDRVVVASCTPRTHETLFRRACEEAGINKYLFEFVNIREHCSWVHRARPEAATQKAVALIEMGVARSLRLEPQQDSSIPVEGAALVVGGGPAGISASLNLARQGFQVHLVEREAELGGMLRRLHSLYPTGQRAAEVLAPLVEAVRDNPLIAVHTGCELAALEGQVGSFTATLSTGQAPLRVSVGTVIVATGAREAPTPEVVAAAPEAVTGLDLEARLSAGRLPQGPVVMVLCVGARSEAAPACGKHCCQSAIKNAVLLKEAAPELPVHILHRDLMACGVEGEALYRHSQELGVRYARYAPGSLPALCESPPAVEFREASLGHRLSLPAALVVLSLPAAPAEGTQELARLLKVPVGQDGFFLEGHVKLRPVEFAAQGVYLCGSAKGPCHLGEAIAQGLAAAAKAASLLHPGKLQTEALTAQVEAALCRGCATCTQICPFGAISLTESAGLGVAQVNEALCQGCGACAPACSSRAITVRHFRDDQIGAVLEAALGPPGLRFRHGPATSVAA